MDKTSWTYSTCGSVDLPDLLLVGVDQEGVHVRRARCKRSKRTKRFIKTAGYWVSSSSIYE